MTVLVGLLVAVMIAAALAAVRLRDLLAAVAAASVVSLALSVLFAILRAPDVALAEAAVGAGLSGVLFAFTIRRIGRPARYEEEQD